LTIEADAALVQQLDQFRRKRNLGAYERAGLISSQEADERHRLATGLRDAVIAWLRREYPALLDE
jgi:hypothetical protein